MRTTNPTTSDRANDATHAGAAGARSSPGGWRLGDRTRCALALLAVPVLAGLVLRAVLYASFHEGSLVWSSVASCLGLGLVRDALVAVLVLAPLLLGLAAFHLPWLARPRVRFALFASVSSLVVFEGLVEFFFFEEFNARFNNIAVDYVLFPGEVAGNMWQSYAVPLHVAVSLAAGCALALLAQHILAGVRFEPLLLRTRARGAATVLGTGTLALGGLWLLPRGAGADRVSDEIAACGLVELVRAFWSANLEFPLYYRTLPEPEAHARAARFLGFPPVPTDGEFQLQKSVTSSAVRAAPSTAPRQIVVVLEESLGSDFVGALPGSKAACTPELERHFADGLLLSNLIANGNRTVRGLEGVLCSFVPLPGHAILSRGKSENVATVARVLRAAGYGTVFFYGGRGTFDHMESFLGGNGWDELVTEPDYPEDAFRTAWGVADEYVFDALLARQEAARARGEPLFATMLSVSNHKPYDFPRDRYAIEPDGRRGAVRYADACIGDYLDALHERGLDADTLVLIVGDHGARVYGAEEIPTQSYRIPALFVTPDARWRGQRIERLCSQIDLVPTLLDLAGIECRAPFFGTSVLGQPADGGRAFVQHNRDVGILSDHALVVLGLQKTLVTYARSGRESHAFTPVPEAGRTPEMRELAADASAVFQSAYELYDCRRFRLPSDPEAASTEASLVRLAH